jgi:hypothetical protein
MSDTAFVLLVIVAGLLGLAAVICAGIAAAFRLDGWLRRRRRLNNGLTDDEVRDALAPLGADISIWPSRAPRNGSAHEDVA